MYQESFSQTNKSIREDLINSSSNPEPENVASIEKTHVTRNKNKYNPTKHFGRMTREQLQCFIEFSREHSTLLTGRWQNVKPLWEKITNQLNSLRGPQRTALKWRENLTHRKNQLSSRARREKKNLKEFGKVTRGPNLMVFKDQGPPVSLTLPSTLNNHSSKQQPNINSPPSSEQPKIKEENPETAIPDEAYIDNFPDINTLGFEKDTVPKPIKRDVDEFLTSTMVSIPAEFKTTLEQSQSSHYSTNVPDSAKATNSSNIEKISLQKIFKLTLDSIKTRNERDEQMLAQQAQLTKALEQLSEAVVKLNGILTKLS